MEILFSKTVVFIYYFEKKAHGLENANGTENSQTISSSHSSSINNSNIRYKWNILVVFVYIDCDTIPDSITETFFVQSHNYNLHFSTMETLHQNQLC